MAYQSFPSQPHPVIAVVGATGVVGLELLKCLETRGFPTARLKLLASARSAGKEISVGAKSYPVDALSVSSFDDVDIAFFATGSDISRQYVPHAVDAGALVIDASSAFRRDLDVPLIVPEVNADQLASPSRLIANPNCVAAITTVALSPLEQAYPIRRLSMATYQAASGAGAAAVEELEQATLASIHGEEFAPKVLPHPYAFNFFSHNAEMDEVSGYNGEEGKVIAETRRILSRPDLPIGITCIRVPILRAHGAAITIEFDEEVSPEQVRSLLEDAPGIKVVDDRARNHFPMPSEASGQDEVFVGRIRRDLGDPSGRSIAMFVVGDQLLKGAALNAVQIAELMLRRDGVETDVELNAAV